MYNLTELFLTAPPKSEVEFLELLDIMRSIEYELCVDWEPGEGWATVLKDNSRVAILRFASSLVFISNDPEFNNLEQRAIHLGFSVKRVADFSDKGFFVDLSAFQVLKTWGWSEELKSVDFSHFSIDELWWATVQ